MGRKMPGLTFSGVGHTGPAAAGRRGQFSRQWGPTYMQSVNVGPPPRHLWGSASVPQVSPGRREWDIK